MSIFNIDNWKWLTPNRRTLRYFIVSLVMGIIAWLILFCYAKESLRHKLSDYCFAPMGLGFLIVVLLSSCTFSDCNPPANEVLAKTFAETKTGKRIIKESISSK